VAKIVLVDAIQGGHHTSYARAFVDGLKKNGHEVYAVGNPRWYEPLKPLLDGAIPVMMRPSKVRTISGEVNKFLFLRRCLSAAETYSPDVVHFLYLDHFVFATALIRPFLKFSICLSLHWAYMLPEFSSGWFGKLKSKLERIALRLILTKGARILVHSKAIAARLSVLTKSLAIDFIPYPLEQYESVGRMSARRFLERKEHRLKGKTVLLIFGDTREDKGADLGIQALARLPHSYHLLIAGKPSSFSESYLRNLACKCHVADRVHLIPQFIPDGEVPKYFRGADIALIPYRKRFAGQSGPLTIAAMFGTPVVAANVLAISETVRRYRLGVLFEPEDVSSMADAILTLKYKTHAGLNDEFIKDSNSFEYSSLGPFDDRNKPFSLEAVAIPAGKRAK
jgi:glycosyltransferase involved in cell wall biosynthesis